jgi:hypothetical protein
MKEKSMPFTCKLDAANDTFVELQKGIYPWWNNLKANKDISIQIRKENTIDVYFNGGAILRKLKYNVREKGFTAEIHPKYIPLADEKSYQSLALNTSGIGFTGKVEPMDFSQLDAKHLKAVMGRIKDHFDSESEKAIQYKFATTDPYIIDTEFQWEGDLRIDLVRLDAKAKKLTLVEIKTIGDPRLFPDRATGREDIHDQLKKYYEFAQENAGFLLDYYAQILRIKIDLGIITEPAVKKLTLDGWQIAEKPLLAFGDCTQQWINNNASDIDMRIKDVACGAYYFGDASPSLDLISKSKGNRHIFQAT